MRSVFQQANGELPAPARANYYPNAEKHPRIVDSLYDQFFGGSPEVSTNVRRLSDVDCGLTTTIRVYGDVGLDCVLEAQRHWGRFVNQALWLGIAKDIHSDHEEWLVQFEKTIENLQAELRHGLRQLHRDIEGLNYSVEVGFERAIGELRVANQQLKTATEQLDTMGRHVKGISGQLGTLIEETRNVKTAIDQTRVVLKEGFTEVNNKLGDIHGELVTANTTLHDIYNVSLDHYNLDKELASEDARHAKGYVPSPDSLGPVGPDNVTLYQDGHRGGKSLVIPVGKDLASLGGLHDLDDQVTDVHIEGKDVAVILYDNVGFTGPAVLVCYDGPRTAGLPPDIDNRASSVRTFKTKPQAKTLKDVLALLEDFRQMATNDTGVFDIRLTHFADRLARNIEETVKKGAPFLHKVECEWKQLKVQPMAAARREWDTVVMEASLKVRLVIEIKVIEKVSRRFGIKKLDRLKKVSVTSYANYDRQTRDIVVEVDTPLGRRSVSVAEVLQASAAGGGGAAPSGGGGTAGTGAGGG